MKCLDDIIRAVQAHGSSMRVAIAPCAERFVLRAALAAPLTIANTALSLSASIGVAMFPTDGRDMETLLQRADIFGARLAPRVARLPMPVTAAMQASYYDEEHRVDEAGAALVKTLGVYPPGAFVRLATQEVAVVLRRGATATTPRVAVVMNRDGSVMDVIKNIKD